MAPRPPAGPRDPTAGPEDGPQSPFPIRVSGPVIKGFGRGSKELGIPTANLPVSGLSIGGQSDLDSGVYFGFVALHPSFFHKNNDSLLPKLSHALVNGFEANGLAQDEVDRNTLASQKRKKNSVNSSSNLSPVVFPAVLSLGYNPFYANTVRSLEIHLLSPTGPTVSDPNPTPTKLVSSFTLPDFYGTPLHLLILGFIRPEYDYPDLSSLITDIKMDCDVAQKSLSRDKYTVFRNDRWLREFAAGSEEVPELPNGIVHPRN